MATDLQCIFPAEVIPITQVTPIQGASPAQIRVVGSDFSSVGVVEVNEREVPAYFIENRTTMRVTLPEGVALTDVHMVSVISNRLTLTKKSIIRFQIGRTPGKVRGTMKLVQQFLKILFTEPGTDIFLPQMGASALKGVGNTFSKDQSAKLLSDFAIAVKSTQRQLMVIQARQPSLPADERLLNAKLTSSVFSVAEQALLVSIEITSQTGVPASVNLIA